MTSSNSMKDRTYRYAQGNILYPFGYGLTYSSVECSNLAYSDFTATVEVKNTGSAATDEVVQIYIKDTCEQAVPNCKLCGFERVHLEKGEMKKLTLNLDKDMFTAVDESGERKVFSCEFTLFAGVCQPDELSEQLCGSKCIKINVKI
ncbi:MAG: fibronectin type III-like domain-contianing protein [Ruminococcus sp.]|nr:fibronectin type III-like domain-contianing protein [Ruminococcus sp.]